MNIPRCPDCQSVLGYPHRETCKQFDPLITKVYFDAERRALGTLRDSFAGDYFGSEHFRVPLGLDVRGMSYAEITRLSQTAPAPRQ